MNSTANSFAQKPTLLDYGLVERGIAKHSNKGTPRERAFIHYVLNAVFGVEPAECAEHIVDGAGDRGVDLVFIDHSNRQINIGSCKTVAHYKNALRAFPGAEIDKVISFVDDLMFRRDSIFDSTNGILATKIQDIWEILGSDPYEIKVHLFSNQLTLNELERSRLRVALSRHRIQLFEHGLYEIAHGIVRAARPKFHKKLLAIGEQFFTVKENGHRGFVTRVQLTQLYKFLLGDDPKQFDERLLDQNVRYFLTLDNAVNQEIKNTLVAGNPHDFWFLNNGITIVAEQVVTVENGCHPITLVNPQIVNGGQTARVIFHVGAETLQGLQSGSIPIKLIETSDRQFIASIAIASNTQSRIFGRDLRANDAVQSKLASAIATFGYFYKRKRGEDEPRNVIDVIDAGRAGQLLLAYVHADPVKSKTNSNDVFEELYPLAFDPNVVTAELVIAVHKIHKGIDARRQKALAWQKSITRKSFNEAWLVEGHLHVLFVVGELLRNAQIPLENFEDGISRIDDAIAIVGDFVEQNDKHSAYRLFRSTSSKPELLSILGGKSAPSMSNPQQLHLDL